MSINDIVAIKNDARLIALVQIIGGAYELHEDEDSKTKWIVHRRPIRVLDCELWGEKLPQPRGTLEKGANSDADTTKVIKEWHERVEENLKKREIPTSV
ncbi:hypothetical protein [Commensalibacter papalotli (ex Botero et al. 2024)]|uniref:Uncharacterized protein n=1 Tax=Commensalibacter papalotli (ex Botero et al. 2024) TaxID=2972766 RepID=A0ABM9HT73_9PROT|nr:hypothetical protein [Commensalibacter papalotli (ex Botero et al. 2024)]CAI3953794.1 unnamed protein product [Commensalibacter papalotli (ex Botero et al. 2024)]CAI3954301.1 unnamed protein product [Commensalibacter papalotli (ex Botero et al. 2024)]